jgi:hypothetical protein
VSLAPLETNREAVAKCLINSIPANDGMRQRLRQGWADDDHGWNAQLLSFDTLNHLEMNGLLGCLELYSTMNMSIDPSVSRRVYFLLVGEQSLGDYWSWTCNYQLRPRMLVCAGGEFQVTFMPIACWPYGTF